MRPASRRGVGVGSSDLFAASILCILFCCVPHSHQAEGGVGRVGAKDTEELAGLVGNGHDTGTMLHGDHDHDHDSHGDHDHEHGHGRGHDEGHSHAVHGMPFTPRCPPNGNATCAATSRVRDPVVWLASLGAIAVISLCGVFGVLVIPIMQQIFYQHLIQFLIALAVGTLAGDALLHLLPHALLASISGHGHDHAETGPEAELHSQAVWKGFIVLAALIAFFLFEKFINAMGEWKERRRRRQRRKASATTHDYIGN